MGIVPFTSAPVPPLDPALELVAAVLDPVLTPLGFAPGQAGGTGAHAQVIFCRGVVSASAPSDGDGDGADGNCVDLVVDLEAVPDWHITDVRYSGYPGDRWHLPLASGKDLAAQLAGLARSLPAELS